MFWSLQNKFSFNIQGGPKWSSPDFGKQLLLGRFPFLIAVLRLRNHHHHLLLQERHTTCLYPRGMSPSDVAGETSPSARAQDDQYSYAAEQWAAQNCVAQRANNTAAGAVIGGLLGALVGGGSAGRRDRGAGVVVGGAAGAITGAAIGNSAATNPSCPPGYVMCAGAPLFYPARLWPSSLRGTGLVQSMGLVWWVLDLSAVSLSSLLVSNSSTRQVKRQIPRSRPYRPITAGNTAYVEGVRDPSSASNRFF